MKSEKRVKVCGMKDPDNIHDLVKLRPDYIGFIFYPRSPRYLENSNSLQAILSVPDEIKKVGVFVNEEEDSLYTIKEKYHLDFVQLHGNEPVDYCKNISSKGIHIIKAFSVDKDFDFSKLLVYKEYCRYFLFDTKTKKYGGSGKKFDWNILLKYGGDIPVFLSGGIDLEDAEEIKKLKLHNLYAVDINSRFEIEPGLKDITKVEKFISNYKH